MVKCLKISQSSYYNLPDSVFWGWVTSASKYWIQEYSWKFYPCINNKKVNQNIHIASFLRTLSSHVLANDSQETAFPKTTVQTFDMESWLFYIDIHY